VAEQSGLIRQLSEWIVDTACRELAVLKRTSPDLRVGINLSMHNLHDYDLADQIGRLLANYQLTPDSLLLEITETGVMLDPDQVIETLDELSNMGLRLSIGRCTRSRWTSPSSRTWTLTRTMPPSCWPPWIWRTASGSM
jgi:EAL domain-containing protein (putative c-di-GMP-specific phosphodiesterase class I)